MLRKNSCLFSRSGDFVMRCGGNLTNSFGAAKLTPKLNDACRYFREIIPTVREIIPTVLIFYQSPCKSKLDHK